MRLSELIKKATELKRIHGNLDILDNDYYSICTLRFCTFKDDVDDYNVKAGDSIIQIISDR